MHTTPFDDRTITELDHIRISRLLRSPARTAPAPSQEALLDALDDAEVLPSREIPPDVVTMNSCLRVEDLKTGAQRELTLSYPEDADPARGFVSVLSPIGAALLGRRVFEEVLPRSPGSGASGLRIVALLFQPEANGEFTR